MPSTRTTRNKLPLTGQDNDGGGSLISPRFVDNGDGTVTDNVTNLMWPISPGAMIPGTSIVASNQIQNFRGAWVKNTAYAVADNATEQVEEDPVTSWICAVVHTSLNWNEYATSHAYSIGDYVRDINAPVEKYFYRCKVAHTSVGSTISSDGGSINWELRISSTNPVYMFDEERTVYPTYWRQTIWSIGSLDNKTTFTHDDATTACAALDYAGYADWRLPNVFELVTMWDHGNEALSRQDLFGAPNIEFQNWASTFPSHGSSAWYMDFANGQPSTQDVETPCFVWPVRSRVLI
jgi:hypothetical protein